MGRRRLRNAGLAAFVAALAVAVAGGVTSAVFADRTENPANSISAAEDFVPPTVHASFTEPAVLLPGETYRVFADVTDEGNPPSGVASVTADMSELTAGADAVTLEPDPGDGYTHRSAPFTVDADAADGEVGYAVTAVDAADNETTRDDFTATVAADPPDVTATIVVADTGKAGYVRGGGGYRVYAVVEGAAAAVTADMTALGDDEDVTLTAGTHDVDGVAYNYRSEERTVDPSTPEGAAAFTVEAADSADNTASESGSVVVDSTPPDIDTTAIVQTAGGVPGWLRSGAKYHVYANVTDDASGVDTVEADVDALTGGQTSVELSPGEWTIGGETYTHRSEELTADPGLDEGSATYALEVADQVGNEKLSVGHGVEVDDTEPTIAEATAILKLESEQNQNPGAVGPGMKYHIYVKASDDRALFEVTVDASELTTGASAVGLEQHEATIDGVTYTHRSGLLTADELDDGDYPFAVTATDAAANMATESFIAEVDERATIEPPSLLSATPSCAVDSIQPTGPPQFSGGTHGSISIDTPTSGAGDLLVAHIVAEASAIDTEEGWSLIGDTTTQGTITQGIYYRWRTADEPVTHTWTYSGGGNPRSAGGILSLRGISTSAPLVEHAMTQGTSANLETASVDAPASGGLLLAFFGTESDNLVWPPGSSMTPGWNVENNKATAALGGETVAAGETGTRSMITASGRQRYWVTHALMLRPRSVAEVELEWQPSPSNFESPVQYELRRILGGTTQLVYADEETSYTDTGVAEAGEEPVEYSLQAVTDPLDPPQWASTEITAQTTTPTCYP